LLERAADTGFEVRSGMRDSRLPSCISRVQKRLPADTTSLRSTSVAVTIRAGST
jgi:hypothetical protein